jgi:hypothetical protein
MNGARENERLIIVTTSTYESTDILGVLAVPSETKDEAITEVFEFYAAQFKAWEAKRAAWWAVEKELHPRLPHDEWRAQDDALARHDQRFPPPPRQPDIEMLARQVLGRVIEWSEVNVWSED